MGGGRSDKKGGERTITEKGGEENEGSETASSFWNSRVIVSDLSSSKGSSAGRGRGVQREAEYQAGCTWWGAKDGAYSAHPPNMIEVRVKIRMRSRLGFRSVDTGGQNS